MLRNASAPYPVMVRVTQCVGVGGMGAIRFSDLLTQGTLAYYTGMCPNVFALALLPCPLEFPLTAFLPWSLTACLRAKLYYDGF